MLFLFLLLFYRNALLNLFFGNSLINLNCINFDTNKMAATTALMPSTSSTTNGSARLKLDNGNDRMGHGSDSDGQSSLEHRTSSDEDEMTEQPPTSATGNTLTQPLTSDDDEDEDALKEIDEPVHQQNSNLLRNQMDSANNDSMASSEDETIVDDNSGGSFSNQIKSLGDKQIAAQLSSLSSLINLKSNTTSDTTANRPRQATGKLAKITERLAQRQNGVSVSIHLLFYKLSNLTFDLCRQSSLHYQAHRHHHS